MSEWSRTGGCGVFTAIQQLCAVPEPNPMVPLGSGCESQNLTLQILSGATGFARGALQAGFRELVRIWVQNLKKAWNRFLLRRTLMRSKTFFTVIVFLICLFAKTDIAVAQAKKIKLGIIPYPHLLPVFLAQEKGWYQEAGLDVETIEMKGGATIIPALMGGSIQVGFSNVISIILARSAGLDIRIVCNSHNEGYTKKAGEPGGYATSTTGLFVLQDSGIRGPKDLEGKKIAVNTIKNIDWMAVCEWMEKNNADPKKVIWVEIDFPKMIPALMGKKVDAVEAQEPQKTILRSQGATHLVNPVHDLRPGLIIASFVAKEDWISKNPDQVQAFVSATVKGQDYLNTHPEERNKLIIQYTKTSPEIAKNIAWPQWTSKVDLEGMHLLIKLCQKHGLLRTSPDLENLIYKTAR